MGAATRVDMAGSEVPVRKHAASPVADRRDTLQLSRASIWVVIPCYRVTDHILEVLEGLPSWIGGVVCVDDACPDRSGDFIEAHAADPRVHVLRLPENRGVGGATLAGYGQALALGARILVKIDGDGQMDPAYLPQLVAPILLGEADYAKGNRFTTMQHLHAMPGVRTLGNAALSMIAKVSTGYWQLFDPTNGYTAIEGSVLQLVMQRAIEQRYFFESDLLYHLGTVRAVVRDVPIPSRYADERSHMNVAGIILPFAAKHLRNAVRRLLGQYFVRDLNIASVETVIGLPLLLFGATYGLTWLNSPHEGPAPAGVVMLAALPVIIGVQFLLQAVNYDVQSAPSEPIHPRLRAVERLKASAA
jgi:glycosyltransferase involved in cell wall biosynthesis